MRYLVDTNLLVRLAQPHHPLDAITRVALDGPRDRGEDMCITPQNLIEFWNSVTAWASGAPSGPTWSPTFSTIISPEAGFGTGEVSAVEAR